MALNFPLTQNQCAAPVCSSGSKFYLPTPPAPRTPCTPLLHIFKCWALLNPASHRGVPFLLWLLPCAGLSPRSKPPPPGVSVSPQVSPSAKRGQRTKFAYLGAHSRRSLNSSCKIRWKTGDTFPRHFNTQQPTQRSSESSTDWTTGQDSEETARDRRERQH